MPKGMKEFYHNMKIFSIIDKLISDAGGEENELQTFNYNRNVDTWSSMCMGYEKNRTR